MNEAGLVANMLYLGEAVYTPETEGVPTDRTAL